MDSGCQHISVAIRKSAAHTIQSDFSYVVRVAWLAGRPLRNKWASCSTEGHLHFNNELLEMDEKVWDYVIVHGYFALLGMTGKLIPPDRTPSAHSIYSWVSSSFFRPAIPSSILGPGRRKMLLSKLP